MTLTLVQHRDPATWNAAIRDLPDAHVLQTAEWGAFKQRATNWTPDHYLFKAADGRTVGAAMTLTRRIGPLAIMYVPKGPLCDYRDPSIFEGILEHLQRLARSKMAIQIKIDPDVPIGTGVPGEPDAKDDADGQRIRELLKQRGWGFSAEQVQFRNTILIDLRPSEDDILGAMGQGKRRKVRYGPRHGVTVRVGTVDDLPTLYRLYVETGERNQFLTRPYSYYIDEWGTMLRSGLGHALIAEVAGQPVAHVILFHFGAKCLYFTGASVSDNEIRKLMPADLLQWEALRWAKAQGYTVYDLWGAPNDFVESDRMWGVFQFKRDFGGTVTRHIGAWDYAPFPPLYALYNRVMPRILNLMRRRARAQSSPNSDASA